MSKSMLTRDLPSYRRQGSSKRLVRSFLLIIVLVFLFTMFVEGFFLKSYRYQSESMQPNIVPGTMLLASPLLYGKESVFSGSSYLDFSAPGRGEVVVVVPPWELPRNFFQRVARQFVEFYTLGRIQPRFGGTVEKTWEISPVIRRVIAIPGDQVFLNDGVFFIKAKGKANFSDEFTASGHRYLLRQPKEQQRNVKLPFSSEMGIVTIGPDEYFVAADNREFGLDSRHWGAVKSSVFRGRVLLRYWPPGQTGWIP
jgi:signal peptidase I